MIESNPIMKVPESIERLPISELGLSTRAYNALRRGSINTVGDIFMRGEELPRIPHVGPKVLGEITEALNIILRAHGIDVPFECLVRENNEVPPPDYKAQQTIANPKVLIDEWLSFLKERSREVVTLRFGLENGQPKTFEEIGQLLGVTRERVRQIEKSAFHRLKPHLQRPGLRRLIDHLRHALVEAGGLATEIQLAEALSDVISVEGISPGSVVQLLLSVRGDFCWIRSIQAWCQSKGLADLYIDVVGQVLQVLEAAHGPLAQEELLNRLKISNWYQANADRLNDSYILACLNFNERIICHDNGYIVLEKWERYRVADIVLALRKLGEPSHYRKIAKVVNANLPPGKHSTPQNIHYKLAYYTDIFVWVGLRGTYGLKEWGLEQPLTYQEALGKILQQAGHPLTYQEILAWLPEFRPYFTKSSIRLALGTSSRFSTFPGGAYGLVEWEG